MTETSHDSTAPATIDAPLSSDVSDASGVSASPAHTGGGRATLATIALVLAVAHWMAHGVVAALASLYWFSPALDWTSGPQGVFFTVVGGLGIPALLIGAAYLALGGVALVRSRRSGKGRARAAGAITLSAAYLTLMVGELITAALATAGWGADSNFLAQLALQL